MRQYLPILDEPEPEIQIRARIGDGSTVGEEGTFREN
jgi:hypothetical protein